MAKKLKISRSTLRHNYRELILVFLAFTLMVVAANISIGRILQERLSDRTEEIIYTADANVRAGLSAAETILLNSYHIVRGMLERGAGKQEILDYLSTTSEWMQQQDQGLFGFYGIYAFIHGEFYDSIGINPDSDFIPQMRPWYQLAIRNRGSVAYTAPFSNLHTGDLIFSAVRSISVDDLMVGVLSVDIQVNWLVEYISSLSPAAGGYGMLLNENMVFMAHPDDELMGRMLQVLGSSYNDIARILRSGSDVSAHRIEDVDGSPAIAFFSQISNGWYVGLVIPSFQFYRDLYMTSLILIALGLALSLTLSWILLRLSTDKMRADEESKAKSSFLASMSHEIRTPMNAITGMAELALREEMSDKARENIHTIKQAGGNLLSIINDILDFSKVEAGLLEIVHVNYTISSLVHDVGNIIRNRIADKPIRFYMDIDSKIPNSLIGDEVRLRQVLLNLLSNAVKYTEKGHINMSITIENRSKNLVLLKIAVSDTGFGIKTEDLTKLFGEFVQLDSAKNQGIEGTGLGLSITRRLCIAMGGNISVESVYGEGSTFTVIIPQSIESEAPFASVENAAEKNVLIYEGRQSYTDSLCWSLENMGVPYTLVTRTDELAEALKRDWFFVISGYGLYERIKPIMESYQHPGGKQPPLLALMVGQENETYIPNVHFVYMPVHSLTIANILNGKKDKEGYISSPKANEAIPFTVPGSRLLVVDDIETNLKVAEGLLAPYKARVDTCLSGREAIEMIKGLSEQKEGYDMVFMDHMMPEMDGIEATAAIRAWENEEWKKSLESPMEIPGNLFKQVPIIALTANAVSGMREMFLEKGFNDFLAKPIDVSKLDEIIDRWILKDKKDNGVKEIKPRAAQVNPGLLKVFRRDAEKAVIGLRDTASKGDIKLYTITAHAMKSALANIGENEKSAAAAALENAGQKGDLEFISSNTEAFVKSLEELIKNIIPDETTGMGVQAIPDGDIQEDGDFLAEQLQIIKSACEEYDDRAAFAAFDRLKDKVWRTETSAALEELRNSIFLHSDFDSVAEKAGLLIETTRGEK